MNRIFTILALALFIAPAGCESNRRPRNVHVDAADAFTSLYASSPLWRWDLRGQAAGPQCDVLVIDASVFLEEAMIESMHYGSGPFDIYVGGIEKFSRDRRFRGVVYRDGERRTWTYGAVERTEAESLQPCR